MESSLEIACSLIIIAVALWNLKELIEDIYMISKELIESKKTSSYFEMACFIILDVLMTVGRAVLRFIYSLIILLALSFIVNKNLKYSFACTIVALILGIGLWKLKIIDFS